MTRRRKLIDDPVRPFQLKVGVAYRVVEENGDLVVREIGAAARSSKSSPLDRNYIKPFCAPFSRCEQNPCLFTVPTDISVQNPQSYVFLPAKTLARLH